MLTIRNREKLLLRGSIYTKLASLFAVGLTAPIALGLGIYIACSKIAINYFNAGSRVNIALYAFSALLALSIAALVTSFIVRNRILHDVIKTDPALVERMKSTAQYRDKLQFYQSNESGGQLFGYVSGDNIENGEFGWFNCRVDDASDHQAAKTARDNFETMKSYVLRDKTWPALDALRSSFTREININDQDTYRCILATALEDHKMTGHLAQILAFGRENEFSCKAILEAKLPSDPSAGVKTIATELFNTYAEQAERDLQATRGTCI